MARVWQELYKKKRNGDKVTDEFLYPARVMNATVMKALRKNAAKFRKKGGERQIREAELMEAEAVWHERTPVTTLVEPQVSEQDRGAQLFFYHAYHCAQDIKPVFLRDTLVELDKIRKVEHILREQADVLKSVGMKRDAAKLITIAEDCEDAVRIRQGNPKKRDPSIIVRDRGDAEVRTFVTSLSVATLLLFGEALHSTLARVANVVFCRSDVTQAMVQQWLRTPRVKQKSSRS
jgi:hypothetical protein